MYGIPLREQVIRREYTAFGIELYKRYTSELAHNGNLVNALELGELELETQVLFSRQRSIQK